MSRILVGCMLVACLGVRVEGQGAAASARMDGLVIDSVHVAPLRSATVMLTRQSPSPSEYFSAATDSLGAFTFDGLLAGRYALGIASPMLDSLGLVLPATEITLVPGERRAMQVGTPSSATIRARACPGVPLQMGQGVLLGRVLDATTEEGLAGASLELRWVEILFDTASLRGQNAVRTQRLGVSPVGEFVACGLPSDSWVEVQVQHAGREGAVVRTIIPDGIGVRRLDLSFDASAAAVTPAASALPDVISLASGDASLSGVVRGNRGEPVREAEVHVRNTAVTARADDQGRFALHGLPAGTQVVEARRLGYRNTEVAVELRGGRSVSRDIALDRAVILDSVLVIAQRARYAEFYEDKKRLFGRFFEGTSLALDAALSAETSALVAGKGGYRVVGFGFTARLQRISKRNPCYPTIVIDGMQGLPINSIRPSQVAALEIFRGEEDGPVKYNRGCGSVVVHTRP